MTRKPIAQRIAELDARKKTLVARLTHQERVRDTRRKILLGALVLHRLEQSSDHASAERLRLWLRVELPGFLVREGDRQLFDDLLHPPQPTGANPPGGADIGTGTDAEANSGIDTNANAGTGMMGMGVGHGQER